MILTPGADVERRTFSWGVTQMDRITAIVVPLLLILAQTKVRRESLGADVIIWAGILMVVLLVFGAIWMVVRAKVRTDETNETDSMFSLGSLRRMHREGQLTDEEFEKAKAIVIGTMTKETKPEVSDERIIPPTTGQSPIADADAGPGSTPTDKPQDNQDALDAQDATAQGPDNESEDNGQTDDPNSDIDSDVDGDEKSA